MAMAQTPIPRPRQPLKNLHGHGEGDAFQRSLLTSQVGLLESILSRSQRRQTPITYAAPSSDEIANGGPSPSVERTKA